MIVRSSVAAPILFTALCVVGFGYRSEGAELTPEARVDAVITPFIKRGGTVGLAVVVVTPDRRRGLFTYGEAVKGSGRLPSGSTLFQIGSITKTFTGLLLAILVERKIVRFEDPVQKYAPGRIRVPTYKGKEISLLDLATHRSGLPRNPPMTKRQMRLSMAEMYGLLERTRLTHEPGRQYGYSNWGFGLLADALVRASSAGDYNALVEREILSPLRMTRTAIRPSFAADSEIAEGYTGDGHSAPVQMTTSPALDGAGALYSNADDMFKYLSFLLGLTQTKLNMALAAMLQPRSTNTRSPERIGLGWEMSTERKSNAAVIEKTGGTLGFQSYIGFIRERETGVVILGNSRSTRSAAIGRQVLALLQKGD